MELGHFAGNFLTAFTQAKQQKEQTDDQKKERDAKMKLFELELKRAQAQQQASDQQQAALESLKGKLGTPDASGKTPGLTDLLADPAAAMTLLQSGMFKGEDIINSQNQTSIQNLLRGGINGGPNSGAPGMGGFEVSGIKLDASGRPMLDLSRKGEVARWTTSPDGRTQIGLDKMGRQVATAPAGPNDRAPEDRPLMPGELADMRGPNGQMLPPGTTLRQAQQIGAKTAPKPGEADKKSAMLLQGMQDAEATIQGMSGTDTSSLFNAALSKTPVSEIFTSAPYRKYETAAKRWAQNYLYLKSGAQASEKEVTTTFHTFFPQPGDSEEVKLQKKSMREQEARNVASVYSPQGNPQGGSRVVDFNSLPP